MKRSSRVAVVQTKPRKNRPAPHPSQSDGAAGDQPEVKWDFQQIRGQMLEGVESVEPILLRRGTPVMVKHRSSVKQSLLELVERVHRNDLPDAYLRIILNDLRLDALIVLGQLKVALLYEHQRLMAPTETIRMEIKSSTERFLGELPPTSVDKDQDKERSLRLLEEDLVALMNLEQNIRSQEIGSWKTSSSDGGMKSSSRSS